MNIAIIYKNFESWRYEILEHIKTYSIADVNLNSAGYLTMLYNTTPEDMEEIFNMWVKNKVTNQKFVDIMKGVKK